MNSKRFISLVLLFSLLAALPLHASAADSVTVEIPFAINDDGAPANVVIESDSGAPLPDPARYENVISGTFSITYSEIGKYFYTVRQDGGPEQGLEYDGTVYNVSVEIYRDGQGDIAALVEIWVTGNDFKSIEIVFTNPPGLRIDKDQQRNREGRTKKTIHGVPGDQITYYVTVRNGSNSAIPEFVLTDAIPEGLLLVANTISHDGVEKDGVITWTLGNIGPKTAVTVKFSTIVPNVSVPSTWVNKATGYSGDPGDTGGSSDGSGLLSAVVLATNEVVTIYAPGENPSTSPTPGTTTEPGVSPSPGTSTEPGVSPSPGTSTEPGVSPSPGTSTEPSVSPPPVTSTEPGVSPSPSIPRPGVSTSPGTGAGVTRSPSPSVTAKGVAATNTGDDSNLGLWFVLAASSLGCLLLMLAAYYGRRGRNTSTK